MLLGEARSDWTIVPGDIDFQNPAASAAQVQEEVGAADIIITQPVGKLFGLEQLSDASLAEHSKPGATFLRYPNIFFRGHHPSYTYLGRSGARRGAWRGNCHEMNTLRMVQQGLSEDQIVVRMSSVFLDDPKNILEAIAFNLIEMRRREEAGNLHVGAADLIEDLCFDEVVMHTFNHPKRKLMVRLANRILQWLGCTERVANSGPDLLASQHRLPILPATAWSLQLKDDNDRAFWVNNHCVDFETYIRQSVRHYRKLPAGVLDRWLEDRHRHRVRGFALT